MSSNPECGSGDIIQPVRLDLLRIPRNVVVGAAMAAMVLNVLPEPAQAEATPAPQQEPGPAGWAQEEGIMTGYVDGTFGPNDPVTRGQTATILRRSGIFDMAEAATTGYSGFPDIAGNSHEDAINWAGTIDIVSGHPDGTYRPNNSMTRGQVATTFHNGREHLGVDNDTAVAGDAYIDTAGSSHATAIDWAKNRGIFEGFGDGTFRPGNQLTRRQMAALVQRVMELMADAELPEPLPEQPPAPQPTTEPIPEPPESPWRWPDGCEDPERVALDDYCTATGTFGFSYGDYENEYYDHDPDDPCHNGAHGYIAEVKDYGAFDALRDCPGYGFKPWELNADYTARSS
ncbi:hypothetical protein BH23PAT1_BH23PAT1_4040 [soil metagenome]